MQVCVVALYLTSTLAGHTAYSLGKSLGSQIRYMFVLMLPSNSEQAGGNSRCREFLEAHSADYRPDMSIEDKWKTKAAHLWRDKVSHPLHVDMFAVPVV